MAALLILHILVPYMRSTKETTSHAHASLIGTSAFGAGRKGFPERGDARERQRAELKLWSLGATRLLG